MCSSRHCPKLSSTRTSLGKLPGTAWVLPGKHRKIRWRTEGRRNPELTRSFASRRARSVCASCHGGWDVSALSLQLSCTVLGVPWGGAAAGERGKAHQGLAHNLHTNLNSNGKLHLGNPNKIIHIHNFRLGISRRTNIDLSVSQRL